MPRALNDIADEICDGWLKAAARPEIPAEIAFVKKEAKALLDNPMMDIKFVRAKAAKAQKAVKALGDFGDVDVSVELRKWAALTKARGPDRRGDNLQWLCAHSACVLVENFGISKPVSTQNGNVHAIAQLIHEAITRLPGSDASGLKAVRAVLAFRKPISQKP